MRWLLESDFSSFSENVYADNNNEMSSVLESLNNLNGIFEIPPTHVPVDKQKRYSSYEETGDIVLNHLQFWDSE